MNPEDLHSHGASNQSMSILMSIEKTLELHIESLRLLASGLDQEVIDSFDANINLNTINLNNTGEEKESSSGAATIIGYLTFYDLYVCFFMALCVCVG